MSAWTVIYLIYGFSALLGLVAIAIVIDGLIRFRRK